MYLKLVPMKPISKLHFHLVALGSLFLALSVSDFAGASQKACTVAEEMQALDEADRLRDWDAVYRSFIRFAHCDDGAIAEGYSDTVGRLLASDWKHIATLARLVASNKKFESFVFRHIDETLPIDELNTIASNAQKSCPAGQIALCRKILESARTAIRAASARLVGSSEADAPPASDKLCKVAREDAKWWG